MREALRNRQEAMDRLRVKPAFFSKIVNGKVKGLPKLRCVRMGRRQLFTDEALDEFIKAVEAMSCRTEA